MLANNYFCTLNAKIMKGILPTYCRTMGYTLLILCVFLPLMMFMFGMINDSNLLFTKASVKLLIWFSLFMIFLAKVKNENEETAKIRVKAICYAIYLLGIYYIVEFMMETLKKPIILLLLFIWLSMYFVWSLAFKRVR